MDKPSHSSDTIVIYNAMRQQFPFIIGERRMAFRVKEWAANATDHVKDYGKDLGDRYFKGKQGIFERGFGALGAGSELFFRGTDEAYSAATGEKYYAPNGLYGRMRGDTRHLLENLYIIPGKNGKRELHLLRAGGNIWRLGTSDLIVDTTDAITGNVQKNTRSSIQRTLAT